LTASGGGYSAFALPSRGHGERATTDRNTALKSHGDTHISAEEGLQLCVDRTRELISDGQTLSRLTGLRAFGGHAHGGVAGYRTHSAAHKHKFFRRFPSLWLNDILYI